ncbi:MAG: cytochrome c [Acidobacteria bacterium]|nr:cytochrome c [Acidobacteriota bacterium]
MKVAVTFSVALALFAWCVVRAQEAAGGAAASIWKGVYTEEQAKRGDALYASHCAACHGPTLKGTEMGPPLTGSEFTNAWSGLTVGDLLERSRAMLPEDPGKMGRQEQAEILAEILAFILSMNKYPAGTTGLSHDMQVLKQIKIGPKPE